MARPAKYSRDAILHVTAQLVAEGGPSAATIGSIARRLDAPTGSIYHRFPSRDLILAHMWVRLVKQAQVGFLAALAVDDVEDAAERAALHMPRWARAHLHEAQVLLLYRRDDLVERWPEELGPELAGLNREIELALGAFTRRRFGANRITDRRAVLFALVDVPYGAIRRYLLAGEPPPPSVDDLVRRTCSNILG